MGDRINPVDDANIIKPPEPPVDAPIGSDLKRASDFLLDNVRIGRVITHYEKYRRYVDLQVANMFAALVSLYETMFRSQWQHFRRFMDNHPPPPQTAAHLYAARVYVSTWFVDLYCSIREATRVISPLAFNERYSDEFIPFSTEYDNYLAVLNGCIRPTHISLTTEDVLYIPILSQTYDWSSDDHPFNPFGIENFLLSHDVFYGLISILKERRQWKMTTISTHALGRPCWLFDWHDDNAVCAPFPRESNYTDTDVTLAYIIGVACTPKLGIRDVDDWIYYPPGTPPLSATQLGQLQRVVPRRFNGSYEVRTFETDYYYFPDVICEALDNIGIDATKKRKIKKGKALASSSGTTTLDLSDPKAPAESTTVSELILPVFPRVRITDWCYYSRVILNMEWHTRTGALRILCLE